MATGSASKSESSLTASDKVANLLGLLLVRELPPYEAIVTLTRVGFSTLEVCSLLNTNPNNVRQANHQARKAKKRKRTSRK